MSRLQASLHVAARVVADARCLRLAERPGKRAASPPHESFFARPITTLLVHSPNVPLSRWITTKGLQITSVGCRASAFRLAFLFSSWFCMPRNAQVVRQWLLLERLERSKGATLDELVDSLPSDHPCHARTVRRDLGALEARFPLITERRRGKTIWRLMDGFDRTIRLAFSQTELMALVFSKDLLRPLDGTELKSSLDSAFNKMVAVLPSDGTGFIAHLRDFFSVGLGPHKKYKEHRNTIECLTRAISQSRSVQIRYFAASRNVTTRRSVDPYRLWYAQGALYLIGFCHLRRDVRMFAVDRIRSITTTNKPCQMPLGFDIQKYVADALLIMRGAPIDVQLSFHWTVAPWVCDRNWHSSQKVKSVKGGAVIMTLRVAETAELVGWILSFGSNVRVLSPRSLRDRVHEEARKILREA